MNNKLDFDPEKQEQLDRGKRIKFIREQELKLSQTDLAKKIGVSSQFLGLVEKGRGNLVYKSVKKLKDLSGHSSDYILYGLDDTNLNEIKQTLSNYSEKEIIDTFKILKDFSLLLKDKKETHLFGDK